MKISGNLFLLIALCLFVSVFVSAQNIFNGEPIQVVGAFNSYATDPYNADYRTTSYRRISTNAGTPTDGRGQWTTTINVQPAGGDVMPIAMGGGGGDGFLFISGPPANRFQNKWVFNGVGQATIDGINSITCYNCGDDMGLDMSTPGYYSFIFNDCGYTIINARYYVAYTSLAPVTVSRDSHITNPGGSVTVNISTNVTPSPEEKIYVRYTTGTDFSGSGSSSVVQASGSGTSYTATIPPQGVDIRFFVFTSTRTLAQLSFRDFDKSGFAPAATEFEKNISVLRRDDNAGNNYIALAPTAANVFVAGRILTNSGRGIPGAKIIVRDTLGQTQTVTSNVFGYFRVNELEAGETYSFEVYRKGFNFAPQLISLSDNVSNFDIIAQ